MEHCELDHYLLATYVEAPGDGKVQVEEMETNGDYAHHAVHEIPADMMTSENASQTDGIEGSISIAGHYGVGMIGEVF